MRATINFSKSAMQHVPSDALRVRIKRDAEGNIMLLPTARKVVSNLPENEVARKLTRDKRGTVTCAVNYNDIAEGVYTLQQGKFNWMTLVPHNSNDLPSLSTPRVRLCKKTG